MTHWSVWVFCLSSLALFLSAGILSLVAEWRGLMALSAACKLIVFFPLASFLLFQIAQNVSTINKSGGLLVVFQQMEQPNKAPKGGE